MRYFLDTEFNGHGGDLISLAMINQTGDRQLYLATECQNPTPWVKENVMPVITCPGARPFEVLPNQFGRMIEHFLIDDHHSVIRADWPDDIAYFCKTLITGPGEMVALKRLEFEMVRIDSYPTVLTGAIQHNALWDARAFRSKWMGFD